MASFIIVYVIWNVFVILKYSNSYDNLSLDRPAVVLLNGTYKETNRSTDSRSSTCFSTKNLENLTWHVELSGVRSIYQIEIILESGKAKTLTSWWFGRNKPNIVKGSLSIYLTNSSSGNRKVLCSTETLNSREPKVVKTKCAYHAQFVFVQYEAEKQDPSIAICEVKILGCDMGVFGRNCDFNCSENCIGKLCDILDGRCLSATCNDGWRGNDCSLKCRKGTFGPDCTKHCSTCKDSAGKCDHVTGVCNEGCIDGYTGEKCDLKCADGLFGTNCTEECKGTCINGSSCNVTTGYCDGGCSPGWRNADCSEVCLNGFYGKQCAQECNLSCDPFTGLYNGLENRYYMGEPVVETKLEIYGLLTALIVSILMNCVFLTMYCKRLILKRKKAVPNKATPMYGNVIPEKTGNEQSGQEQDSTEMETYYETLDNKSDEQYEHNYASLRNKILKYRIK